jgi:hypothetical protein
MEADMKVIRVGLCCLLAFLVLGAMLAGAASAREPEYPMRALPEWGHCIKVAVGKGAYKGGQCVVREHGEVGKWEWIPAKVTDEATFEGAGTPPVLKTAGHETIECVVGNLHGKITEPRKASVELELQGCAQTVSHVECGSASSENVIKFNPMEAELGYIKYEEVEGHIHFKVGLDLKAQTPLTSLATYKCGSGGPTELPNTTIEGSVIAADKPNNAMKSTNVLKFHVTLAGAQDPEKFQELPKDTLSTTIMSGLETLGPFPTTLGMKEYTGKYNAPIEIKATEKM